MKGFASALTRTHPFAMGVTFLASLDDGRKVVYGISLVLEDGRWHAYSTNHAGVPVPLGDEKTKRALDALDTLAGLLSDAPRGAS